MASNWDAAEGPVVGRYGNILGKSSIDGDMMGL